MRLILLIQTTKVCTWLSSVIPQRHTVKEISSFSVLRKLDAVAPTGLGLIEKAILNNSSNDSQQLYLRDPSKYEACPESKDTKVLNMYNIFNLQKRHCE